MISRNSLDVRQVKSSLVATFARANPPLIWRFDLERNHSFTLALQGEDHAWELGVTSPKGEFQPVASFPSREDAEEAFVATSAVLAKRHSNWLLRFLKIFGLVVLGCLFLLLLASAAMRSSQIPSQPQIQGSLPPEEGMPVPLPPSPPPPTANGIPLPADDVLKPPAP